MASAERNPLTRHQDISGDYTVYSQLPYVGEASMAAHALKRVVDHAYGLENLHGQADRISETLSKFSEVGPANAEQLVDEARAFLQVYLGRNVTPRVVWLREIEGGNSFGANYVLNGAVGIVDVPHQGIVETITEHLRWMGNVSTLVHEMMHYTGLDTRKILGVVDQAAMKMSANVADGMTSIKVNQRQYLGGLGRRGTFFEEACAEEATARWRESVEPARTQHDGRYILINRMRIPWRYLNTSIALDESTHDTDITIYNYSATAHCTEALRQISEYTRVDLFDLMQLARYPGMEAQAKRHFIDVIEDVEPGLYKKLRELSYGEEQFIEGRKMVEDAIARRLRTSASHSDFDLYSL